MKNINESGIVAQGAAAWNEKETHEQNIKLLSNVYGEISSYIEINGYCYYWQTKLLSEEDALSVVKRGNHDEIMYMIHQYGKAICPAEKRHFLHHVYHSALPESVQEHIAQRNHPDEMEAFLSYWGFGERGQDVVLDRNDHDELMGYLNRHGFLCKQQRKLKERNNRDEIVLHIRKHGWADELLDEMFDNLARGFGLEDYYEFINNRELPVKYQKKMLQIVRPPEFEAYVDRYGLWNEVHEDLVEYRLLSEVRYYLERHPYLDWKGECKLAQKGLSADKAYYIKHKVGSINGFLWAMFYERPLDYELLTECFLKITAPYAENEEDILLMKNGTHEQVMLRIGKAKLGDRALANLFFRNNPEEFESYLDKWIKK